QKTGRNRSGIAADLYQWPQTTYTLVHATGTSARSLTPTYRHGITISCDVAVHTIAFSSSQTAASQNRIVFPAFTHFPSARNFPCTSGFRYAICKLIVVA